jgi:hypothetical protein
VGDTVHVIYNAAHQRSTDGGKTWSEQVILVPDDSIPGQQSERTLAASGCNVYFVWPNTNASDAITSIKIRRSTDAGWTWLEPQVLVINQPFDRYDFPMVAAESNWVYVVILKNTNSVWQWFLTRSSDHGETWDSIRQVTFAQYNHGTLGDFQTRGK